MTNETRVLLEIYRQHPCRTLPNAFWKTKLDVQGSRLSKKWDTDGQLTSLAVWQNGRLLAFRCADPDAHTLTPEEVSQTSFALVHQSGLSVFDQQQFSRRTPYFRLAHNGIIPEHSIPSGYHYQVFNPQVDIEEAAILIQSCYPNTSVDVDEVHRWLDHPVYHPNLWVWIMDDQNGEKAGLGIAEFDLNVPEVSLEWIQVLPDYQGNGLGKALVSELVRRSTPLAKIVTVSGQVDHQNQPKILYRRCGFQGSDVWWLLQK